MNKEGKILIADDDKDILLSARAVLRKHFEMVALAENIADIKQRISEVNFDVVLLDMNFKIGKTTGDDGLNSLQFIKENNPFTQVIIITAYADIELAVKAIKLGALDFIIKPWENKKLLATTKSAVQLSQSKKETFELKQRQSLLVDDVLQSVDFVSESKVMVDLKEKINKIANTDANILIFGKNGTGKEVVAKSIHKLSSRNKEIFVKVDLGAIPESLFESELFGYKKGAFTDAKEDRMGKFELSGKGTLFLDEIGNLPLHLQSKLLSVIQNRSFTKLGGNIPINVESRIICATNMNLKEMIEKGDFRQDLYYRINTVELYIPELKDRKRDIVPLAKHFANVFSKKYNKANQKLTDESFNTLKGYHFPGNVRELQNIIERAVIMSSTGQIEISGLDANQIFPDESKEISIEAAEKEVIKSALQKNGGNISKAAEEIGMGRTTIYRKMKKYGL